MDEPVSVIKATSDDARSSVGSGISTQDMQLRTIFDTMQAGIILVDSRGIITLANQRMADMFRCTIEELVGSNYSEYLHPEQHHIGEEKMQRLISGAINHVHHERLYMRKDGSHFWGHLSGRRHEDAGGNLISLVGVIADISETKHAEEELKKREQLFSSLADNLPDVVSRLDRNHRHIYVNRQVEAISGIPVSNYLGKTNRELGTPPELLELWESAVNRAFETGQKVQIGFSVETEAGTKYFESRIVPEPGQDGAIDTVLCIAQDITQRKHTEEALRQSEQRYRTLFDTMQEGFALHEIINNADGRPIDYRFLQVNGAFEQMTGFSRAELIGSTVLEIMPDTEPGWIEACGQVALTGEPAFLEYHAEQLDRYFEVHVYRPSQGRISALYSDVTERKILQQEREKAQRLSSLGVLAGGIAHDFNNILTGIIGNISLAAMMVGKEHKAAERLTDCQNAAHRAAELTQQLITFSRGGEPVRKVVDAARLINETLTFCMRGSNVRGDLDCAPDLWKINVDAGQIHQVLNNLLINARQSMEAGGTVRVRAENCEIHKGDPKRFAPGRYIRITVQDEGCGIPAADLEHIFDPYFTTKKFGTGLGLTSVYSIVRRHGGQVQVSSAAGQGTTFTLYLPALTYGVEDAPEHGHKEDVFPGSGRILVMDDEKMIRNLATTMLKASGYEVENCKDGAQAVECFIQARKEGRPFDVVILDLTVPGGMGGREAAELIREQDRDVILIVSSGYSSDHIMADYLRYGFNAAVAKPYTMQNITGEVSRMLAQRKV